MKIKWFGQSCFLITAENGKKILTDPFKNMLGYKLPEIEADIVSTSHNHSDHNNISAVKSSFIRINELGAFTKNDIAIKGVETFHDNASGAKKGKNTVYNFTIDGIHVCHLGDLGHVLSSNQIQDDRNCRRTSASRWWWTHHWCNGRYSSHEAAEPGDCYPDALPDQGLGAVWLFI